MDDEDLDKILGSLPTPPPAPGFWDPIDRAIRERGMEVDAGRTVRRSLDPEVDLDPGQGAVVELERRRRETAPATGRILLVAASVVLIAGAIAVVTRLDLVGPAPPGGPPSTSRTSGSPSGALTVEQVRQVLGPSTAFVIEPRFEDVDGDGTRDGVAVTRDSSADQLTVAVVDGVTATRQGSVPVEGAEVVDLIARPGRITVVTRKGNDQWIAEIVGAGDRLVVDRVTPDVVSEWALEIEGAGRLGLIVESCTNSGGLQLSARTAAGTTVRLATNASGTFLFADGPQASAEGKANVESLRPLRVTADVTEGSDAGVGARIGFTITGPGC